MDRRTLTFNNKVSSFFGIYVKTFPEYIIPEENVEVINIPGKNGDVIIPSGSFKNVERKYEMNVSSNNSFINSLDSIIDWLQPYNSSYHVLLDSNDVDHFRYARLKNNTKLVNIFNKAASFELIFDCKPQRYKQPDLHTDDTPFLPINSQESLLTNPYYFIAKPIFKIVPPSSLVTTTTLVLTCTNNSVVEIFFSIKFPSTWEGEAIYIDYETESAYTMDQNGVKYNANDKVTINGDKFTGLKFGSNTFSISTGGVAGFSAYVYPRWWTL